tara:strand:+ start:102 stop:410 length:309 start_codon:yes stop_codon:yes gene_type:complete
MKKFLKQYNTILEQDEAEVPVEEPAAAPVEQPAPEPEAETFSPESEVLLVRLLKKALVTKVNPNDIDKISLLADINETNAKESLTALINIMKQYSQDIDVET